MYRVRESGRTVIVGDVHGCREELDALLDKVAFSTGDRLVFVGDLVARGPDTRGVLDVARRTGAVVVRGNHEEKLLQWYAAQRDADGRAHRFGRVARKRATATLGRMHLDIALRLREVDWTLLATSPLWFDLPEHGVTVVHAGMVPGVPVEEQDWDALLHMRSLTARGAWSDAKTDRLWGAFHRGPSHVVFGHNARGEPQLHRWATGIDTACVYGGRLSAMVLGPGEKVPRGAAARELLVSVPALRVHYDWTKKKQVA